VEEALKALLGDSAACTLNHKMIAPMAGSAAVGSAAISGLAVRP